MARSRRLTPEIVRARLTVAAERLAGGGDKDLAEAVEAVLAPRGWSLLKPATMSSGHRNVPLYMSSTAKAKLEDAARKAGEESGKAPARVLAEVVNEGWEKALAGQYEPVAPVRAPRGKAPVKENLNVRPDNDLRERMDEAAPELAAELGWDVTAGKVAMSYLFDEFGISDEDQLK